MPPKIKSLEELVQSLSEKIDAMSTTHKERFDTLDSTMKKITEANTVLTTKVQVLEQENTMLKTKLHDLEIHSRSTNIRVINFQVTEPQDFEVLAEQVYDQVLFPILQGAASKGRIRDIPSRERLIVSAHLLPAKEGHPPPIFCRLLNGSYRSLILQHQKEFGRRRVLGGGGAGRPPPCYTLCLRTLRRTCTASSSGWQRSRV